jgi:hypothetical protein
MKKNQIILIIIGVLILIGIVSSFSYWLGQKSIGVKKEIVTPDFLTSKVTEKWNAVASGKVTEISDRKITLNRKGESLAIPISETAKIYLVTLEDEGKEGLKEVRFEDIKVGKTVNISLMFEEGKLEGHVVNILPE